MIFKVLDQFFLFYLRIDHPVSSRAEIYFILRYEHNFSILIDDGFDRLREEENIRRAISEVILRFEVAFNLIFILLACHDIDLNPFRLRNFTIYIKLHKSSDQDMENRAGRIQAYIIDAERNINIKFRIMRTRHDKNSNYG